MRLVSYNYSQLNETVISFSSQNPNFPASNIRHEHRSKEWKSSGNFTIVVGKNSLDLLEPDEISIEVPVGTYTTDSLVEKINEMLADLESVTRVRYTENSGIWTFFAESEITVQSSSSILPVLGFNVDDFTGEEIDGAQPAIHTEEFVVFDLKTSEEIDTIAVLWGKDRFKLSPNGEIRAQASATANFSALGFDQEMVFSSKHEIASLFLENPVEFRYWRILIKDPANVNLFVNIGVLVLGLGEKLDPDNGFQFGKEDLSKITKTDFGQEYVDKYPILASLTFNISLMEYSLTEKLFEIYEVCGSATPIFVALDPEAKVFNKDRFSIYGKFSPTFAGIHNFYDLFAAGLTIREVN